MLIPTTAQIDDIGNSIVTKDLPAALRPSMWFHEVCLLEGIDALKYKRNLLDILERAIYLGFVRGFEVGTAIGHTQALKEMVEGKE